MKKRKTTLAVAGVLAGTLAVAGCSSSGGGESAAPASTTPHHGGHGGHDGMNHDMDGGPVPEGMTPAANAKYPVGTRVTLTADHMEGMDGASARVVGAYDTHTYAIDFTPTNGGAKITDHKWVVQQELEGAGDKRLADGTQVTVTTDHMHGMKGAKASIASSTDETVYVVDYQAGDMTMKNHKWVVESEMQPAA